MALQISTINATLPKLIDEGRNLQVAQSRFYQEMNKVKEMNKINPGGVYTPYTVAENSTAFAVAEGGPILSGAQPEYAMGVATLRQHWASRVWPGAVGPIANQFLTQFRSDPNYEGRSLASLSPTQLNKFANNLAVKALVISTLKMYARRENFFAVQGNDQSATGIVTSIAGIGAEPIQFSWDTTNQGNRLFAKNQQIQFFDPGGVQRVGGLATVGSSKYNVVLSVDKTPASGDEGPVVFAEAPPTDVDVGDTAVFRNSYGLMPQGFIHYIDDTGTFKGITRSDNP